MPTVARILGVRLPIVTLAPLAFAAGVCGMAVSFVFLSSSHALDVTAGAAGFVAGSILVAAGLVSASLQRPRPTPDAPIVKGAAEPDPPLDVARWTAHFESNREDRPEPDWSAPVTLPEAAVGPLVRSLEQFQLGDGGGPAYLIARDRERFLSESEGTRKLVDLWF